MLLPRSARGRSGPHSGIAPARLAGVRLPLPNASRGSTQHGRSRPGAARTAGRTAGGAGAQ
eukprot:9262193-Alexandrium_andersonii.AAC.1